MSNETDVVFGCPITGYLQPHFFPITYGVPLNFCPKACGIPPHIYHFFLLLLDVVNQASSVLLQVVYHPNPPPVPPGNMRRFATARQSHEIMGVLESIEVGDREKAFYRKDQHLLVALTRVFP